MPSLDDLSWPRRTPRLTLRRLTVADAPTLHAYRSLPDTVRWQSGPPEPLDALVTDFDGWIAVNLAVEHGGALIGDLHLRVGDGWSQTSVADRARSTEAELGWTLTPEARGHGYATEAVTELLAIAFDGLGLRRVVAEAFADNTASVRVMEKVGMRLEGRQRADSLHAELGWIDGVRYALLAEEWRQRAPR